VRLFRAHANPQHSNLGALIHGGGHERGMRSGTLATHQIVGMGGALLSQAKSKEEDNLRISQLPVISCCGRSGIVLPECDLNLAGAQQRVPHNLNLAFLPGGW